MSAAARFGHSGASDGAGPQPAEPAQSCGRAAAPGESLRRALLALVFAATACGRGRTEPAPRPSYGKAGVQASFDLDADTAVPGYFYDLPWPSGLRTSRGHAVLSGFPNPRALPMIETFRAMATERGGFPVLPVAYFRFSGKLAPVDGAQPTDQAFLVDLQRGTRLPAVIATPPPDDYVPQNLLAVAPRPGLVLAAHRTYAFVVLRSLNDAAGAPLGMPAALDQLRHGLVPEGTLGLAARDLYAPLWPLLDPADIAAATVFTTGDVVAETAALSEGVRVRFPVTLDHLAVRETGNDRACVLTGTVTYPQFQKGRPPFDRDGLFVLDESGAPQRQRDEIAPVMILVPRTPMPAVGYPLAIYFHGSGGSSADVLDRGPTLVAGGQPQPGTGPGWVLAGHGIASAASALPVNPERLPGASETAYLNFLNLPAMRDTFRQGVLEQRMFIEALRNLRTIGCDGAEVRFDPGALFAQGQSMGGMYTNLVSATEPRIRAAVPTGAGGFWTYFILVTKLHDGLPDLVAVLLGAAKPLTFLHPALQLIEMAWEPADPVVSMPRLGARPLPGHPARPVYEPVGRGDQYFPTVLYDAVALAYQHHEAGAQVWPTMQESLALAGLEGLRPYPVRQNRTSDGGVNYTGVVVQFAGDGLEDPHAIYRQLPAVKHQYGCFLETFLRTGVATVVAPGPENAPCQ